MAKRKFNMLEDDALDNVEINTNSTDDKNNNVVHIQNVQSGQSDIGNQLVYKTTDYSLFASYPKAELRLELHEGKTRDDLKESIIELGISTPIKVIESSKIFANIPEKYTVLCGHNRLSIAKELNIEVPYIVQEYENEDICDNVVAVDHIYNRQMSDFKPSEMMHLLIAIKKISKNQKEFIEKSTLGKSNTYNYLQMQKLIPEILYEYVDTKIIQFRMAMKLSRIEEDKQRLLYDYLKKNNITKIQEKVLSDLLDENTWNKEMLDKIFSSKNVRKNMFKIDVEKLLTIVPQNDMSNIENIIIEALKQYYNK